jgi:hypothetical protein
MLHIWKLDTQAAVVHIAAAHSATTLALALQELEDADAALHAAIDVVRENVPPPETVRPPKRRRG